MGQILDPVTHVADLRDKAIRDDVNLFLNIQLNGSF
jgi:hypothetical protein